MLLVAAILGGLYVGSRQVYFLGTDEGGRIALYRGVPYELPLGVNLYSEVVSSPTRADSLPEDRRDEVVDHELRSRGDAVDLLANLEDVALAPAPTEPQNDPQAGAGAKR